MIGKNSLLVHLIVAAIVGLGMSGCAGLATGASDAESGTVTAGATSVTVPSPSSFDYVAGSTKILFASPEAFLADNPRLQADVIQEQCHFDTPDPPIMIPNEEAKGWTFTGRLDTSTPYMQALEYRRVLLPGVSGPEQVNTWPVKLETLSALPDIYLEEQMASLANAKLAAAQEQVFATRYLRESSEIEVAIEQLERDYIPGHECLTTTSNRDY